MKMRVLKKTATAVRWEEHVEKVLTLPPEEFTLKMVLMLSR